MIPIASTAQMRECDRITIEELGLPGLVLMENASRSVAFEILEWFGDDPSARIVWIVCGKGNNGGDGFAVARHLKNAGITVYVTLLGDSEGLKGDAKFNCELFRQLGGEIFEISGKKGVEPPPNSPDLIVDALLGTGFTGSVRGKYAAAIEMINDMVARIVAVDIPSGVEGDSGSVNGPAIEADVTVTFGLLKQGLVLPPGRELAGDVIVADIGIPPETVNQQSIRQLMVDESDVRRHLPHRKITAHKGDAGHVYLLAGAPGLTGAAAMSAKAAMRTGAGLVVVGVPCSLNPVLETKLDEAMTQPLPETGTGCLSSEAVNSAVMRIKWAHAVAIGPGLGQDPDTLILLENLLPEITQPLVLDADGLNHIANKPALLESLPEGTILTPHPGELARLTGLTTGSILSNRIETAREWAAEWRVVLVLKGSPTVTASPDGTVYINSTGNPGMATGGSGDVLTGIIASLAAQGIDSTTAAWMGVYLHGVAGDIAKEDRGVHGMVAGDIIDSLPGVIKKLT